MQTPSDVAVGEGYVWATNSRDGTVSRIDAEEEFHAVALEQGTTSTVSVAGELDLATAPRLEGEVYQALSRRPETLVLDLGETTFIDSTGLRTALGIHARALATGLRLVILPAPEPAQRVFRLCRVERQLPFVAQADPDDVGEPRDGATATGA